MTIHRNLHCPECKTILEKKSTAYSCPNCKRIYPVIDDIPSFIDDSAVINSFDSSAFTFLFEMEKRHFYYLGRREMILDILRNNVQNLTNLNMLEIGCGNGSIMTYLMGNNVKIEGGDIFMEALRHCRQQTKRINLYRLDILCLPFDSDFDIIGAFDVLEHIANDDKAITEMNNALRPGGYLILTVPAYQFLWSNFDESAHHQRRYNKNELIAKLETKGFTIRKTSYFMFFLFPLLAIIRLIGRNRITKNKTEAALNTYLEVKTFPIINDIFLAFLRLEKWLMKYANLPFGTTLLVVARKPEEKTNGR